MKKIFLPIFVAIILSSCDPTTPIATVDTKIKTLTVIFNRDSAFYNFSYNSTNQLENITKNSVQYYKLVYSSNKVLAIKNNGTIQDTTSVFISTTNYIDSVRKLTDLKRFYRNSSMQLDSILNNENNLNLFHKVSTRISNNILTYQQSLPYTCNLYSFCTVISLDTILYSSIVNQSNLPEQFVGYSLSEVFSFVDLNPIFLLQQSGIFPYKPHTNLLNNWHTKYSIFISQNPPSSYNLKYAYVFDIQNRVTSIKVYNLLSSATIPFKQYFISY